MVCHHLAVDAVSWRILLEDFQTAYEQLKRGKAALLPAKTTSFRQWAKRLVEYARSEDLQKELNYWTGICEQELPEIPVDCPTGANTEALAQNVQVTLGTKETTALLQEVPKAYGTEINDILLTALVQAFAFWTGDRTLLLELEGHGRENIFEDVDVSRTVGWFTTTYPVYLNLAHVHDPGTAIKTIKEQLRQVPDRGIGFGILRYLNDQVKNEQLTSYPHPEVAFNYLGRLDQALPETSMFSLAQESSGPTHSPRGVRIHLLDINSSITAGQLQVTWTYSRELYQRSTIEGLANNYLKALIAVIEHCQSIDLGMYTPSDFPDVELSQDEIENLMTELEN